MINTIQKPKTTIKNIESKQKNDIKQNNKSQNKIISNQRNKTPIKTKTSENNILNEKLEKLININDYTKLASFKSISDSIRPVYYICSLNDDRLATCSFDHSIKIYDNKKYKLQQKIKCHKSHVVYIIQLLDGRLLSCSRDCTMKLIKLTSETSYKVEQTISNFNGEVIKVIQLSNSKIISCSVDPIIKIFDLVKKTNKFQLENNLILYTKKVDSILELKGVKELISSSHKEKLVVFWKINLYEKICSLNIECCERPCVLFELNKNFAAIGGNGIYIIELKSHQCTNILQSNLTEYFYLLKDKTFLTIESYYSLRHYKIEKKRVILIGEIQEAHKKCIYSITQFKNGIIATADFGGLIKLWK